MLTDEVGRRLGEFGKMRITRLLFILAIASAAAACTAERAISPQTSTKTTVSAVGPAMMQVPLLYVVDGVRLQRDQVPTLTNDQIAQVTVIKGHAALKQYGPDASYGVVVITTKTATLPHS